MKKILSFTIILLSLNSHCFSQDLEGDRLLDLIGKSLTDPLYLQLKQQEHFINDYIDQNSSIQVDYAYKEKILNSVIFMNGWIGVGSGDKYGAWHKKLPFGLNWTMAVSDLEKKLGKPVSESDYYAIRKDYLYNGWKIKMEFSNNLPVKMAFENPAIFAKAILNLTNGSKPLNPPTAVNSGIPVKLDANANVEVNWPALKDLITSCNNMKPLTGKDSVDYFGEVFYATPYKVEGFGRTAIKHKRKEQQWYFEAFYKTTADTNQVRKIYMALQNKLDGAIKDNTGDDLTFIVTMKKGLSAPPVTWISGWSLLSTKYTHLPPGLGNVRITLLLVGKKDVFNQGKTEYTIKLYIDNINVKWDFYTWDKPQ
jgi:hypothetical protein